MMYIFLICINYTQIVPIKKYLNLKKLHVKEINLLTRICLKLKDGDVKNEN